MPVVCWKVGGGQEQHPARSSTGSELAIDALVVATTIRLGGGMILTHDPGALELLAVNYANVRVVAV